MKREVLNKLSLYVTVGMATILIFQWYLVVLCILNFAH
ncbi:hypothetical protein ATCC19435_0435 [Lactococcus lactis subsp. lactis]|nr:hypothetical protein ATCC19435_0435 [Lactococcus lactis subsp. lactis]